MSVGGETVTAQILDGKRLAQSISKQLSRDVGLLQKKTGQVPHMVNVMLGGDGSACAYANSQKRVAEKVGIRYDLVNLPKDISQNDLISYINTLNADSSVHGIMLHKPVPAHINYREVANCFAVAKDLEGINVTNIGKLLIGETRIMPCTPAAVMELLDLIPKEFDPHFNLRGQETVVVGASEIVGKPLSILLWTRMATVTVCHVATSEAGRLEDHIGRADVLIVAVGKPELVKGQWIKDGAVVVDVGINVVGDRIVGDVEFGAASKKASFLTPVPGGVGPVTVVMLMRNGIEAFRQQMNIPSA